MKQGGGKRSMSWQELLANKRKSQSLSPELGLDQKQKFQMETDLIDSNLEFGAWRKCRKSCAQGKVYSGWGWATRVEYL